jgi:hypothetical protein
MILDAAETLLGYFGFDRTVHGNKRNTATRKWNWLLQDLKEEREKDIRIDDGKTIEQLHDNKKHNGYV